MKQYQAFSVHNGSFLGSFTAPKTAPSRPCGIGQQGLSFTDSPDRGSACLAPPVLRAGGDDGRKRHSRGSANERAVPVNRLTSDLCGRHSQRFARNADLQNLLLSIRSARTCGWPTTESGSSAADRPDYHVYFYGSLVQRHSKAL